MTYTLLYVHSEASSTTTNPKPWGNHHSNASSSTPIYILVQNRRTWIAKPRLDTCMCDDLYHISEYLDFLSVQMLLTIIFLFLNSSMMQDLPTSWPAPLNRAKRQTLFALRATIYIYAYSQRSDSEQVALLWWITSFSLTFGSHTPPQSNTPPRVVAKGLT